MSLVRRDNGLRTLFTNTETYFAPRSHRVTEENTRECSTRRRAVTRCLCGECLRHRDHEMLDLTETDHD
jgi:hypothetical protein